MKQMTFTAFASFKDLVAGTSPDGDPYKVPINPETFDRSITVSGVSDRTAQGRPGETQEIKAEGESYSFDLMFDGTGVYGRINSAKDLKEEFRAFLNVVYRKQDSGQSDAKSPEKMGDGKSSNDGKADSTTTPPVNYVLIEYCGESFKAMLTSLSIKYLLFNKDGDPLRIKASCRFRSATPPEKQDPNSDASKPKDPPPPVENDTPNKKCIHPDKSFEKTVEKAEENNAVSLMCCCYPPEQMTPLNYTPANYTPVQGYGN